MDAGLTAVWETLRSGDVARSGDRATTADVVLRVESSQTFFGTTKGARSGRLTRALAASSFLNVSVAGSKWIV